VSPQIRTLHRIKLGGRHWEKALGDDEAISILRASEIATSPGDSQ
jgi:hypothetical protein